MRPHSLDPEVPPRAPLGRGGWLTAAALFSIVLVAGLLRLTGIGYLLPNKACPDGEVLEVEVRLLQGSRPDIDRGHGAGLYPQLLPRIAAASISGEGQIAQGDDLDLHLRAATAMKRGLRVVLALLSLLIVPATWLIARRFLTPGWSLVAAAFMSLSFLHLWFSQQERPHAAAASFVTWVVVLALGLRRRAGVSTYIALGIAMGLAVGALQSGLAVLPAGLVAFVLRRRDPRPASAIWALASIGILALMTWYFYPFVFDPALAPPTHALGLEGTQVRLSGHNFDLRAFDGSGFATVAETFRSYEPLIGALALCGLVVWCLRKLLGRRAATASAPIDRERRADLLVVLAYALPYLLAIGMFGRTYQRFVIPLMPYAACLTAYGLCALAGVVSEWSAPAFARRAVIVALVALPLGAQAFAAYRLVSIRAQPDTITLAARWIAEHARPREERILVQPALDLPLFQTAEARAANERMLRAGVFEWFAYQATVPPARQPRDQYDLRTIGESRDEVAAALLTDARGYLRELHGDYAVIEVFEDWGWRPLRALRAELKQSAVRVARFIPDGQDRADELPFLHQEEAFRQRISWFWRTLSARRTGPVVEIYALAP